MPSSVSYKNFLKFLPLPVVIHLHWKDAVGVDFRFTCLSSFPIFELKCNASTSHSNWPDGCIYSQCQTQTARRVEKGIANWKELRSITFPFFFSSQVVAEFEHILDKYVLYFGQIHTLFPSFSSRLSGIWIEKCGCGGAWTNTVCNMDKYILQYGQIHFAIWTNTLCNMDKYSLQYGQIQFAIWTNTVCN